MTDPIIQVRHLAYTYMAGSPLETIALRDVSIKIAAGQVVGIIGPAGAGKSTLLLHLNGLLRPTLPGIVIIDGIDLSQPNIPLRQLRQTVGLVFQRPERQIFERLVGEDIAFGPRQMGLDRLAVRERVRWAMKMVGLDFQRFVDRPTFSLSGGERRKVALAGVLALKPKVLALDEATTGLDPMAREEFLNQLRLWREEAGLTLIIVSSDMDEIAELCEWIYVLVGGRTVLSGQPAEVFSHLEELDQWKLGLPTTVSTLAALRSRGHEVNIGALTQAVAQEELCRILPS